MFINVFTKIRHWTLFQARKIKFISSHSIYFWLILILPSYLYQFLQSGLFPPSFLTKHCIFFLCHTYYMPCLHNRPYLEHSNNTLWRQNYKAPHYAVFCSLLLPPPSWIQHFPLSNCSETTSVCVFQLAGQSKIHIHTKQ